jgi:mono/diheme cytochrome c family protein
MHEEGGARKKLVLALADRIFHSEVANGTCRGCHGSDARGSRVGADLTEGAWLWSDGSLDGIAKTITQGFDKPSKWRCDACVWRHDAETG